MTALATLIAIPPRNTDAWAFRARMDAKAAENRRHEALILAAQEAARRPVRQQRVKAAAKVKRAAAPRVYATTSAADKVAPCTACGHPTRPSKYRVADFPGTRPRREQGKCTTCVRPAGPRRTAFRVDESAVLAAYAQPGASLRDAARAVGCTHDAVRRVLKAHGVPLNPPKRSGGTRKTYDPILVAAVAQRWPGPVAIIARDLGLARSTVSKIVERYIEDVAA